MLVALVLELLGIHQTQHQAKVVMEVMDRRQAQHSVAVVAVVAVVTGRLAVVLPEAQAVLAH
jgi:hypothetical protein